MAEAVIPGAGRVEGIALEVGGPQGRPEIPEVFNRCMQFILAPCIKKWIDQSAGLHWDPGGGLPQLALTIQ
eukprot:1583347-Lingulodinium_polyedra.AAC.1